MRASPILPFQHAFPVRAACSRGVIRHVMALAISGDQPEKTPRRHPPVSGLSARSLPHDSTRAHTVSGLVIRSCPGPVGVSVSPRSSAFGLHKLCDASLPVRCGPRTAALHALAMNRALRMGFQDVNTVAIYWVAIAKLERHFSERDALYSLGILRVQLLWLLFAVYAAPLQDKHAIRAASFQTGTFAWQETPSVDRGDI
jgi:hypothetical protein